MYTVCVCWPCRLSSERSTSSIRSSSSSSPGPGTSWLLRISWEPWQITGSAHSTGSHWITSWEHNERIRIIISFCFWAKVGFFFFFFCSVEKYTGTLAATFTQLQLNSGAESTRWTWVQTQPSLWKSRHLFCDCETLGLIPCPVVKWEKWMLSHLRVHPSLLRRRPRKAFLFPLLSVRSFFCNPPYSHLCRCVHKTWRRSITERM